MIEIQFNEDEKKLKFNCEHILKIEDITKQCNYEDEFENFEDDLEYISCCAKSRENSITHFYNNNFEELKEKLFGKIILKSICECCKEKGKNLWKIEKFKECVKRKLKEFKIEWNYD